MRVLLVQSYLGPSPDTLTYPLGLAYIASAAQARGHDVRIFDSNVHRDPVRELERETGEFRPDCIGISLRNIDSQSRTRPVYYYKQFQREVALLRELAPDLPIIVGGTGFSMFAEEIMTRNSGIDFGVYLEAEESFPELLQALDQPRDVKGIFYRNDGNVVFTGNRPLPDFASLPFPRRDFSAMEPYLRVPHSIGVQTKRGCPLRCAYCNYPHLNGRRHRLRGPQSVADELEYLANEFGVREVAFADSVLNVPREHAEAICQEMVDRDIRMDWDAYMHLKGIDREFAQLAKAAGCKSMLFSPDGISQAALDGLQKDLTQSDINGVFRMFLVSGEFRDMHVGFCYFISPPGETVGGLLEALWFYLRVHASRLRKGAARMRAYVGWIRLEPHTAVYEEALRSGAIAGDRDLLPAGERELKQVFYEHPRLKWMNPLLRALFRLLDFTETMARRILKRRRAET